jgi:hypothetical protein
MATQQETTGASKEAPPNSEGDVPTQHAAGDPFSGRGPQDTGGITGYSAGNQLFDPGLYAGGGGHSAQDGITARPGGGQALAVPLTASINRISACRTAGDSVCLPRAAGGQIIMVRNAAGTMACQIFAAPGTTDLINGIAGSTGVSLPANGAAMFASPIAGMWFWILSA